MAISTLVNTSLASFIFQDTLNSNIAAVVKGSSGILYMVDIDNTALAATIYVKMFNSIAAITVGTSIPDWVFMCPASVRIPIPFPGGVAFSNGLQVCTTTAGGTAGSTAVATPPTIKIAFT